MIYIDASELKTSSRLRRHLPTLLNLFCVDEEAVTVPDLESRTGADLMLTQRRMPLTDTLLKRHLDDGALLVQLKFGNDFSSSFGARLHEAMWRMHGLGTRPHQRILMFVGDIGCDKQGTLYINGRMAVPKKTYSAYHTAVRHWNRWGVYHPESRRGEPHLPATLKAMETGISEPPREEFWPTPPRAEDFDYDDIGPPAPVKDWRLTIATFPGVGPKRATALKRVMEAHPGAVPELPSALSWITAPKEEREFMNIPKIPLWGDVTFDNCRTWMFGEHDHSVQQPCCKLVVKFGFFCTEEKKYR